MLLCPPGTDARLCNWLMFVCQAILAQNPMLPAALNVGSTFKS